MGISNFISWLKLSIIPTGFGFKNNDDKTPLYLYQWRQKETHFLIDGNIFFYVFAL